MSTNSKVYSHIPLNPPFRKGEADEKAAILLSGGVDSAVAAILMRERGFDVEGFFMHTEVFSDEIEAQARRVADTLGIKLSVVDVTKEFNKRVIGYFKNEYQNLRTPNPCVACNRDIKFGVLYDEIRKRGFETIATGHYIQKVQSSKFKVQKNTKYQISNIKESSNIQYPISNIFHLFCAKDQRKDQSYFLYNLTQEHLKHPKFPLGDLTKNEVREIARKNNIPISQKESYDICFLRGDHNKYLQEHLKLKPGPIVDKMGKEIGQHFGLPLYTIGQRRWINIGGTGPYYVLRTDLKSNTLYVTSRFDDEELYRDEFEVEGVNWIGENQKSKIKNQKIGVKIRYLHPSVEVASIEGIGDGRLRVKLAEKQRAVTAGQSAVFYGEDEELLGGGIIN